MTAENRLAFDSQWVVDAQGPDGEPVPPSVLAEWRRFRRLAWSARRRHSVVEMSSLVVSAAIPALAAFALDARLIAAVGSLAVLFNGIRALGGYKENWTGRTQVRYAIEREIALFAIHQGKYAGPDAAATLVETVEEICARQRDDWAALRLSYLGPREAPVTAPRSS